MRNECAKVPVMQSVDLPPQTLSADVSTGGAHTNVKALDRGLKVLTAISDSSGPFSVSEVAQAVGMTRTAARRFLLTLEHLGYVALQGHGYVLQPRVLELGEAYLSNYRLGAVAHPFLEELAAAAAETVSLTVLHQGLVTYVDRVQASRILAINIVIGSRVPAYATATGTVLLAGLEEGALEGYLSALRTFDHTEGAAETSVTEIRNNVFEARRQGWFLADQQLRSGIRSLAAPVADGQDRTIAAINISASASRVDMEELKSQYLEPLRETAEKVSAAAAID